MRVATRIIEALHANHRVGDAAVHDEVVINIFVAGRQRGCEKHPVNEF